MDRLVVSLLNTGCDGADLLETPIGTARWWGALGMAPVAAKPRFDAALAAMLRALRTVAARWTAGEAVALPIAFRGDASDAILFEVAHALRRAAEQGVLQRVRRCSRQSCGRYFLDQTKNGSRRWCSLRCMERARAPRRRTITR